MEVQIFNGYYLDWNHKKIKKIIDNYGHQFFHGKRVIDLGAGHGDIGGALYRLGADVTCVDAREEHIKIAAKKFPGIKTSKVDLDINWPFHNCDIILDLDLLNHLKDFKKHLSCVCKSGDVIILESAVCDSDNPDMVKLGTENKSIYDWSFNGFTSFPTAAAIEKVLFELGMTFKRVDSNKLNSLHFVYDWTVSNSQECNPNKRRLWFITKESNNLSQIVSTVESTSNSNHSNKNMNFLKYDSSLVMPNTIAQRPNSKSNLEFPIIAKNNNLRVALCLSGYLRTFEQNYAALHKNVLSKLNCDVFIHTWDTIGNPKVSNDNRISNLKTQAFEEKIKKFYSPKKLVIEPSTVVNINNFIKSKGLTHDPISVYSMFYKIKSCNNLKKEYEKENGFKYDCVIRCRTDLDFKKPFILNSIDNLNKIYFPKYGDYGGYNDQFAFSNSENMDIYSRLYDDFEKYLAEGIILNPEILIKHHIRKNELSTARTGVDYVILRPHGGIQDNFSLEKTFGFLPANTVNILKTLPLETPMDSPLITKNIVDLKVAVCLSGHLRTFEQTGHNIVSNLIKPTNADVFIHTWDTLGFDPGRGDSHSVNLKTINYLDKINSIFKPKDMVIEDFFQQNKDKYIDRVRDTRDPANVLGMFYKIKKCNELKQKYENKNNFKYDVVIRCRADLNLDSSIYILDFLNLTGKNIYLPKFDYFLGLNDKFAFGSSDTMDKYSDCIDNIPMYYDSGCIFNAESIMKEHLHHLKLNILRCDIKYTIFRVDGFKFSNT